MTLAACFGPPGGEGPVVEVFAQQVQSFCQIRRDGLGSILAEKSGTKAQPRLMVAAHLDEIGFMIQGITGQGYLRLQALGGWEPGFLPGQRLLIQSATGFREGVVAALPVHFRQDNAKPLKMEDLLVDIGADSPAAVQALGVSVGDLAVPKTTGSLLNDTLLVHKAWDDRVGVAAMVAVLHHFQKNPHPNTLVAVGTVQEEVGSRGASTAVELARPDLAIVLEGPPADDLPGLSADPPQGALGQGVQIRLYDPSIIIPQKLWRWAVQVAQAQQIPYQLAVRRSGATDARAIHVAHGGVPTLVLGVPVRYAHSPASIIHLGDVQAMIHLTVALLAALDSARLQELVGS